MIKILIPMVGAIRQLTGSDLTGYNITYPKVAAPRPVATFLVYEKSYNALNFRKRPTNTMFVN